MSSLALIYPVQDVESSYFNWRSAKGYKIDRNDRNGNKKIHRVIVTGTRFRPLSLDIPKPCKCLIKETGSIRGKMITDSIHNYTK